MNPLRGKEIPEAVRKEKGKSRRKKKLIDVVARGEPVKCGSGGRGKEQST